MKWGVAAACSFEVIAITTGKVPTITMLCGRHRWLAPLVIATLAVHLYRSPRARDAGRDCLMCAGPF